VLLALAARPAEPGGQSELLAALTTDPAARVVRPRPLSEAAVAKLVRAARSDEAHDSFCAACHEATGGNPFMLGELLLELSAEHGSATRADAAHVREVAPATIQRAILARLARLPERAATLARAVAVLGDDADPRQAAALAELDRDVAAETADALAAADILEPGRPLRFAHPLVRNAVYADLPGTQRTAAHRRAARLLKDERAEPERIAIHLLATDPAGDPGVVETLDAAARRALDRAAPETAIAYLRRALAEPPDPVARRELLRNLSRASIRAADRGAIEGLLSSAFEELSAEPQTLMASAAQLSFWLFGWGRLEDGLALLERATRAAIEAGDYDLVMRFESLIVLFTLMPPEEMRSRLEPYKDRVAPDTPGERLWLATRSLWGAFAGEPAAEMAEIARVALEGGKIFSEQPDFNIQANSAISVLITADELEAAEHAVRHSLAEMRARGAAPAIAAATWMSGVLEYARGNIARAEPDARAAVEAARQGGYLLTLGPFFLTLLVLTLIARGELEAAEAELATSGLGGEIPDDHRLDSLLHSRGCLRLAQGRTSQGLEDLAELGSRAGRHGTQNFMFFPTAAEAAIALAVSGQQELARPVAELYLGAAKTWGTNRVIGIGLHALGVVEGGERGIELLREAVTTLERSPARLEHARALTDLGAALRRANRRAEARGPLRTALDMARAGGALAIAKRAHDELEATGEKLRPLMAAGVESLTPSERRVADLAGEGSSNREIAQTLFLSVKTVETHLSHAYSKLDIRSRSELKTALAAGADAV
jgi:DNA-binding CsgD family transcriptional regulator